jgi:hypothetical protein
MYPTFLQRMKEYQSMNNKTSMALMIRVFSETKKKQRDREREEEEEREMFSKGSHDVD